MDKIKNIYETMFVVNNVTVDESVTKATVEKFTSLIANNGEIIKVSEWGKKRLAYPIDDMTDGYFTVVWFRSEPDFPSELERLYNIDENVIRSIVLRLEEEPATAPAPEAKPAESTEEETVAEESAEEPAAETPVEEVKEEAKEEVEEAAAETPAAE